MVCYRQTMQYKAAFRVKTLASDYSFWRCVYNALGHCCHCNGGRVVHYGQATHYNSAFRVKTLTSDYSFWSSVYARASVPNSIMFETKGKKSLDNLK